MYGNMLKKVINMSKYKTAKDGLVKDTETGATGIFRTVGGRRIFIKDGEDLATAMQNSGKFKKNEIKNKKDDKKAKTKLTDEQKKEEIKKLQEEFEKTSLFDPKKAELRDKINMLEENFEGTLEEYRAKKEKDKQERIKAREEKEKIKEQKVKEIKEKRNQLEKDIENAPKDKLEQYEIIKENNPMLDDYHVGIRSPKDIKNWEEVINDEESFAWGDFTKEDAEKALKKGSVTVYSSYPIRQGTFVSTSKIQAEEYAGGKGNKVYSKEIPLSEVAWINGDEGQYAKRKKD